MKCASLVSRKASEAWPARRLSQWPSVRNTRQTPPSSTSGRPTIFDRQLSTQNSRSTENRPPNSSRRTAGRWLALTIAVATRSRICGPVTMPCRSAKNSMRPCHDSSQSATRRAQAHDALLGGRRQRIHREPADDRQPAHRHRRQHAQHAIERPHVARPQPAAEVLRPQRPQELDRARRSGCRARSRRGPALSAHGRGWRPAASQRAARCAQPRRPSPGGSSRQQFVFAAQRGEQQVALVVLVVGRRTSTAAGTNTNSRLSSCAKRAASPSRPRTRNSSSRAERSSGRSACT